MPLLLEAQDLTLEYAAGCGVRGFTLRLAAGDIVGLAGLNGAGKSTTLRLLGGLLRPTRGSIRVLGANPLRDSATRRYIGFVADRPALYHELRVREQLGFAARLQTLSGKAALEACKRVSSRCALDDVGGRVIRTLSTGYHQRISLAMALLHDPNILLLDEPTEGLDPHQTSRFRSLVRDHAQTGAAILSSHRLEIIARLCNRFIVLHQGRKLLDQAIENASTMALQDAFTEATGVPVH